jgi:hypothetical protein
VRDLDSSNFIVTSGASQAIALAAAGDEALAQEVDLTGDLRK